MWGAIKFHLDIHTLVVRMLSLYMLGVDAMISLCILELFTSASLQPEYQMAIYSDVRSY